VVLLDSTAPADSQPHPVSVVGRLAIVMPGIGYLGAGRAVGSFLQEFLEGSASVQQAASLTDLHGKPIVVVTADTGHDAAWQSAQRQLATLSTNSQQRTAHATHQSLVDDKVASAAASDAIRDVVISLRNYRSHQPR